ncbi:MAG TPA: FAD:protein FMN transferase [Jatrophihabitans sp.]|jgi:thiamine biosynthesis lipoprotein
MGTVFTIDVRDPGQWDDAIAEVVAWLHRVDAIFSTYREDSDISRIRSGSLRLEQAAPELDEVLHLCARACVATGGAFTAMCGAKLDPTGLVKGWAVEQAAALLHRHGSRNHAVNGGGDMQLVGGAGPDRPWSVGITDPHDGGQVISVVMARDLAIATSGVAQRGLHIVDPFTGRPATGVASATVIGPSLALADAYATAAVVLGPDAVRWLDGLPGYDGLLVTADHEQPASAGWTKHTTGITTDD